MNARGTATELPAGRLSSFEDDDNSAPDLGALLQRRSPRTESTAPAAPTQAVVTPESVTPVAPTKKVPAARGSRTAKRSTPAATMPKHSERANRIRSSSVHVPAQLLEQIVAYRDKEGLSNGQVVIKAIEEAQGRLDDLVQGPATAGGGGLFAARASRGVRSNDGPLTPLNVRLFEQDFVVIDQLVEDYRAFSRGHLITVALTDFFANN